MNMFVPVLTVKVQLLNGFELWRENTLKMYIWWPCVGKVMIPWVWCFIIQTLVRQATNSVHINMQVKFSINRQLLGTSYDYTQTLWRECVWTMINTISPLNRKWRDCSNGNSIAFQIGAVMRICCNCDECDHKSYNFAFVIYQNLLQTYRCDAVCWSANVHINMVSKPKLKITRKNLVRAQILHSTDKATTMQRLKNSKL